jgi:hypothetical protein
MPALESNCVPTIPAVGDRLEVVSVAAVGIEPVIFPDVSNVKKLVDAGIAGKTNEKLPAIAVGGDNVSANEPGVLLCSKKDEPDILAAVLVAD